MRFCNPAHNDNQFHQLQANNRIRAVIDSYFKWINRRASKGDKLRKIKKSTWRKNIRNFQVFKIFQFSSHQAEQEEIWCRRSVHHIEQVSQNNPQCLSSWKQLKVPSRYMLAQTWRRLNILIIQVPHSLKPTWLFYLLLSAIIGRLAKHVQLRYFNLPSWAKRL